MKLFEYKGELVSLTKTEYHNGRTAITMQDLLGMPYTTCTINLPEYDLKEDEVIIKNYSENEGIRDWLREHNIISPTKRVVQSGYILAPVVTLNPEEKWTGYKEYTYEEVAEILKHQLKNEF